MEIASPNSLLSLSYFGVEYDTKKTARETLSLESNQTASFVPSLLFDANRVGPCTESVQVLFNRVLPTLTFKNDVVFIQQLKVEIQDHVENRFQLFWQQLLMVNKTNMEFFYSETALHQAGLVSKRTTSKLSLQEAHSSTIPCLLMFKDGKKYVFGSGSSFYNAQNMTVKVPVDVNKVDSWSDGATKEFDGESLRQEALHVLRNSSKSIVDPLKGFQRFVDLFLSRVEKYDATHTATQYPNQKLACRFYLEVITAYKTRLAKDDTLIRALCFERRSKAPLDEAFFFKVQACLHDCLIKDMRIQEQQSIISVDRHLSNTQSAYAKIYLNSPELKLLLSNYFKETDKKQLQSDWNKVVQITPKNLRGVSPALAKIIAQTVALIKKAYQVNTVQKMGAIFQSILFQASVELSPDVTPLYVIPGSKRQAALALQKEKPVEATPPPAFTITWEEVLKMIE